MGEGSVLKLLRVIIRLAGAFRLRCTSKSVNVLRCSLARCRLPQTGTSHSCSSFSSFLWEPLLALPSANDYATAAAYAMVVIKFCSFLLVLLATLCIILRRPEVINLKLDSVHWHVSGVEDG